MAVVIKRMGVRQWVNVPDNPRQRDTVRHANKAKRKHLKEADEAHGIVFAAMLDGEITWKLDGHTRAYLWDTGELELPKGKLTVVCFNVSSE